MMAASSAATHCTFSFHFFLVSKPRSLGTLESWDGNFSQGSACCQEVAALVVSSSECPSKCHSVMNARERCQENASILEKSFESMSGHRFNFGGRIQNLECVIFIK